MSLFTVITARYMFYIYAVVSTLPLLIYLNSFTASKHYLDNAAGDEFFKKQELDLGKEINCTKGFDFEAEFERRHRHLVDVCQRRYGFFNVTTKPASGVTALSRRKESAQYVIIDDKHQILFCLIPKVASTFWSKVLLANSGVENISTVEDVSDDLALDPKKWPKEALLRPISEYSVVEQMQRLQYYTKVVWVRHPLLRLASTWHSKLVLKNDYYQKMYSPQIVEKYRDRNSTNGTVTLKEFLRYVADQRVSPTAKRWIDVHWAPFFHHCLPCHIDYQIIGKMEHFTEEGDYVMMKLFGRGLNQVTKREQSNGDSIWREELAKMPPDLTARVAHLFGLDFDLFGYDRSTL